MLHVVVFFADVDVLTLREGEGSRGVTLLQLFQHLVFRLGFQWFGQATVDNANLGCFCIDFSLLELFSLL